MKSKHFDKFYKAVVATSYTPESAITALKTVEDLLEKTQAISFILWRDEAPLPRQITAQERIDELDTMRAGLMNVIAYVKTS